MKLFLVFLFFVSFQSRAITIKLAALAPKGTNWANSIQGFANEVKEKTDSKVKFKVFLGGVQGDEPDALRKIRIGQLHAGVFTGKTLGDIHGDLRVIELPFNFYQDRAKAKRVLDKMTPYFDKVLKEKGMISLGFYEVGNVYLVSTQKISSIDKLKGAKMWSWEGDELVNAMVESLGLVSVPLALPDVLSSLSTGIIDTAYAPPMGILALQWQSKVKYIVDFPTAYSIGALIISEKRWKRIKPKHQQIILDVAKKYVSSANQMVVKDNEQGLSTMKKQGIEFVKFDEKDLSQAEKMRESVKKKVVGKVISPKAMEMLESFRK